MDRDEDLLVKTTTRITPDTNIDNLYANNEEDRSYLVDDDSYIYGDAEATVEDTIETMTVYDPEAERYEEIEPFNAE